MNDKQNAMEVRIAHASAKNFLVDGSREYLKNLNVAMINMNTSSVLELTVELHHLAAESDSRFACALNYTAQHALEFIAKKPELVNVEDRQQAGLTLSDYVDASVNQAMKLIVPKKKMREFPISPEIKNALKEAATIGKQTKQNLGTVPLA